ncbi:uncharacterized protein B0H18DRAFT_1027961 [Fomitopsis serialis]|uniref:uncharacterized protein n=1 Tax=Fomitopsis serialis TaxID=139415 RepID=UPI0020086995|nr:uncharacterized protein B0H18DRAFT_1027961 [Neoantrodia serialis]KAH9919407.1 hypothetical protein B0H18DRAFT_1027961 [Neoantrodia serialis]
MHRTLAVPELVDLIAHELEAATRGNLRLGTPHLPTFLALALTSRTFLEPALDVIWRVQTGLGPLVRCLPEDLWTVSELDNESPARGILVLKEPKRRTVPQDWHRFDYHARRIRSIYHNTSAGKPTAMHPAHIISRTLCAWLLSSRPSLLLPNLSYFRWDAEDPALAKDDGPLHLLFGPRLSTLYIGNWSCDFPVSAAILALRHLPRCSPALEELDIGLLMDGPSSLRAMTDVLATLKDLKLKVLSSRLRPRPIHHRLVLHISSNNFAALTELQHLTDLTLGWDVSFRTKRDIAAPNLTFNVLKSLVLEFLSMNDCVDFFFACQTPRLEHITVSPIDVISGGLNTVDRMLRLIHERCPHTTMETITFDSVSDSIHSSNNDPLGCEDITMATLRHLCDFHNLRDFGFFVDMHIVLDDDAVKEMAMSWPRMKSLRLYSAVSCTEGTQTATTLEGLAYLARYCPSLEDFTICVDTSAIITSANVRLTGDYCNQTLTGMSFDRSPAVGNPADVADFLSATFPNLYSIEESDMVRDASGKAFWQSVRDILRRRLVQKRADTATNGVAGLV